MPELAAQRGTDRLKGFRMVNHEPAPSPAQGGYESGFAPVARTFAAQLRDGREIGAGLTVYHRGRCVVDVWGGVADVARGTPWRRDTRAVVFSVTKGLTAMALAWLGARGKLDWDAPVARYWPGFAASGKEAITVRALFNHRAGLLALDEPLRLEDCLTDEPRPRVVAALERQRALWAPGERQGYHAITYGMYARELFERVAGESLGTVLRREFFEPLGADVSLGTPPEVDARVARIYPPHTLTRAAMMLLASLGPESTESRVFRAMFARGSLQRRAFLNPRAGATAYDDPRVWRAELAWASATASAHGLARAYLPFALGGAFEGRTFLPESSLTPLHERQSWSERDAILQKPVGWSQGFLKEEPHLFSPNQASFGHAGMGGALGFCDPVDELTIGYVMNRMDWRVRSPRAVALCRALYACEPIGAAHAFRSTK